MSTPAFIPELLRAANEVEKLTPLDMQLLLKRAAATIHDLRALAAASGRLPPVHTEIVVRLNEMAKSADVLTKAEASRAFLDAADTMRTLRILLRIRQEIESGENRSIP
jgi:hypothetical protein